MGTMMQKYGLKAGELPELLSFTDPGTITEIHEAYYRAGSDFVSSNTFGCNRYKLGHTGYTVKEVVLQAVKLAKDAASRVAEEEKALDRKSVV